MQLRSLLPICLAAACGNADAGTGDWFEPTVEVEVLPPTGGLEPVDEKKMRGECASGCSLKKHPVAPFTVEQFTETLAAYAEQPFYEESEALDTLLFYGRRTRELIDEYGTGPLPDEHVAFLQHELARDTARVQLRIVALDGATRAHVDQRVPVGIKQHLHAEVKDLQPLEFNGTVMRVGLNTVWSRY